jgi:RNA polymerase sigma-70 factor, ECF subfamily
MEWGTKQQEGVSHQAGADRDADLVVSVRKGDLNAFELLVTRHQKQMFNIACRITGDSEDAAEVVQDAFVSAYRNIRSFKSRSRFSTWLVAITINCARNRLKQYRSRMSREPVSLDDPVHTGDGKIIVDPPSREPSVLDRIEQMDIRRAVQDCISRLEPGFREVLVLRDLQDFSYEEIGKILNVREGTVKSRLFRARESVRECLKRSRGER